MVDKPYEAGNSKFDEDGKQKAAQIFEWLGLEHHILDYSEKKRSLDDGYIIYNDQRIGIEAETKQQHDAFVKVVTKQWEDDISERKAKPADKRNAKWLLCFDYDTPHPLLVIQVSTQAIYDAPEIRKHTYNKTTGTKTYNERFKRIPYSDTIVLVFNPDGTFKTAINLGENTPEEIKRKIGKEVCEIYGIN